MTLMLALSVLLEEAKSKPAFAICQIFVDGQWRNIPLEWNASIRLAQISGGVVRMLAGDGSVIRTFSAPVGSRTPSKGA